MTQHGPRDTETVLDARYTLTDKGWAAVGHPTPPAALFVDDDGYEDPTIWLTDPDHPDRPQPVLSRTDANAVGFDALTTLIRRPTPAPAAGGLAQVRAFHDAWGDTTTDEIDPQALWEGLRRLLDRLEQEGHQ